MDRKITLTFSLTVLTKLTSLLSLLIPPYSGASPPGRGRTTTLAFHWLVRSQVTKSFQRSSSRSMPFFMISRLFLYTVPSIGIPDSVHMGALCTIPNSRYLFCLPMAILASGDFVGHGQFCLFFEIEFLMYSSWPGTHCLFSPDWP